MAKVVLLSTDLMISSLVSGAVGPLEATLVTVGTAVSALEAIAGEEAILVIDLRLSGLDVGKLVASARQAGVSSLQIVAFGPHVHEANLAAAREAGCDAVLTRGQFDREASAVIGAMLNS